MSANLKKIIKNYQPSNPQEAADKSMILYYMTLFSDVLTRENKVCHFTSSAFVINEAQDKVLMAHHNIFNSYAWLGGHLDGNADFLAVAEKEAKEEAGLSKLKLFTPKIISLDVLPVFGHYKNGEYISAHQHLSITCLFIANETEKILPKIDENSAVKWISFSELDLHVTEKEMLSVYHKIINKILLIQNESE